MGTVEIKQQHCFVREDLASFAALSVRTLDFSIFFPPKFIGFVDKKFLQLVLLRQWTLTSSQIPDGESPRSEGEGEAAPSDFKHVPIHATARVVYDERYMALFS